MARLDKDVQELKHRLAEGAIQRAYQGILSYMSHLRAVFADRNGERSVSGLYQGYLDMTYFALFPVRLKKRDLKLAIVFNYQAFRFEVWLAARNRQVQRRYWELLRGAGYNQYPLIAPAAGTDAIVESVLADKFSLEDQESLTSRIIEGVRIFEKNIIEFLNGVAAR